MRRRLCGVPRRAAPVLLGLFLALAGCATEGDGEGGRVLRVAYLRDQPPLSDVVNGEPDGFDVDAARELASALGRPVQLVRVDRDELLSAIRKGKVDLAATDLAGAAADDAALAFTRPYLRCGMMIALRQRDLRYMDDLRAALMVLRRVGVVEESPAETFVKEQMARSALSKYRTVDEAGVDLESGKIDMVVAEAPLIARLSREREASGLRAMLPLLTREYRVWAVSAGNTELLDEVNAVLDRWRSDGTLERCAEKWIPHYREYDLQIP